eukprot:scaffold121161_cov36-Phaeocystis_antarctica.AAC.1
MLFPTSSSSTRRHRRRSVFAPAAPLLYFIGGGALLVWAAMQKLALCKIYRKPRTLDEKAAMRSNPDPTSKPQAQPQP